jgi:hypothetical protein
MERYEIQQQGFPTKFYNVRKNDYDYGYIDIATGKDVIRYSDKLHDREVSVRNMLVIGYKSVPLYLTFRFELQENSSH